MQPDDPYLTDSKRLAIDFKLSYTPNNYYILRNGRKLMRDSKWPTFILNYRHAVPVRQTQWSDFSFLSASIEQDSELGLLSNLNYKLSGGYFLRSNSMHFSDFMHFKSFPVIFDLIGFDNAFTLLDYYRSSTNDYWIEAHTTISSAYLLIKLLPWFSERFWKESVGLSYLKTPGINHYFQAGYSLQDILFLMDLGIYVGFEDFKYHGVGFKINFKIQ
jgi:hypothetical protein